MGNKEPTPDPRPLSGVIDTMTTRAPGLTRTLVDAMAAAGLIDEPLLVWKSDPVTRTIVFSAPAEVR